MNTKQILTALFAGSLLAVAVSATAAPTMKPQHAFIKDCTTCHTQANVVAGNAFVVPDDKACEACHGSYDKVAKLTAGGEEPNPHFSNHYGQNLSCTACHAEHKASKVYCNDCHEFRFKKIK